MSNRVIKAQGNIMAKLAKDAREQPAKKCFIPVSTQVACEIIQASDMSEGGIALAAMSAGTLTTTRARVVAVGPKVEQVKEGDIVLISSSLELVRHMGWELLMVNEVQVIGIELPDAEQNKRKRPEEMGKVGVV